MLALRRASWLEGWCSIPGEEHSTAPGLWTFFHPALCTLHLDLLPPCPVYSSSGPSSTLPYVLFIWLMICTLFNKMILVSIATSWVVWVVPVNYPSWGLKRPQICSQPDRHADSLKALFWVWSKSTLLGIVPSSRRVWCQHRVGQDDKGRKKEVYYLEAGREETTNSSSSVRKSP